MDIHSKLELKGERITVPAEDACSLVKAIFVQIGYSSKTAGQVAEHLVDTSLCDMESNGLRQNPATGRATRAIMKLGVVEESVSMACGSPMNRASHWHG